MTHIKMDHKGTERERKRECVWVGGLERERERYGTNLSCHLSHVPQPPTCKTVLHSLSRALSLCLSLFLLLCLSLHTQLKLPMSAHPLYILSLTPFHPSLISFSLFFLSLSFFSLSSPSLHSLSDCILSIDSLYHHHIFCSLHSLSLSVSLSLCVSHSLTNTYEYRLVHTRVSTK